MSFELLRHLLVADPESVASKSYLNCHVRGVHSLMLIDHPGQRVRMFVATPEHEMWRNTPRYAGVTMSLGYHAHHCNLTIHAARGIVANVTPKPGWYQVGNARGLGSYRYKSKILDESAGSFERLLPAKIVEGVANIMYQGDTVFMTAQELHTVWVPKHQPAAWFVYEGKEDPAYDPITYSDEDLTKFDFTGMYVRPTVEQVKQLVSQYVL